MNGPLRDIEMEAEVGGEGGMLMMCQRVICRIDITNQFVPAVTALGHVRRRALSPGFP